MQNKKDSLAGTLLRMTLNSRLILASLLIMASGSALAYVGPGLGAGAIAAVLGTVLGVLMLAVGVVWYPIKRLLRRFRSKD